MLIRGDLILDFDLAGESAAILRLSQKYHDRRMDLADACLVRMTELDYESKIWTVDRKDFSVYRRNVHETIPCEFPPARNRK